MDKLLRNFILGIISQERREKIARTFMNSIGYGESNLEVEAKALAYFAQKTHLKNFSILDIGASVGSYSKNLLKYSEGDIVCFEPSKVAFKKLEKNFFREINSKNSRIKIYNLGLINKKINVKSYLNIYSAFSGSDQGSLLRKNQKTIVKEKACFINIDQALKLVENQVVGIKLDIEGYEYELIKSFHKLFVNPNFICIQFEYGVNTFESKVTLEHFYNLLSKYGFVIKRISPYGLINVNEYSYLLEVNWPTNYIAVKKTFLN